ncbi:MAG TPA: EamA family transporter [Candidatus Moranbacteria bacterium]|jgi:drug/metabolite transporter (DMT)-like permease|nr:EamA family transporter [Candidatus Moranbacteria bacterium]HOF42237.1 EamA family transporter [Candidatus Moranbacteria bacterium]HPX94364.1 EamA family transporter [Candidatus Moranbacteria bacterium]HQB59493.1 EamA family transporter [Candidatus Moranbacteria bacterium]
MAWFFIATAGYFFGAIANTLDKFLLGSKRISSAPVYAFYAGLFGLGALLLAPFGFTVPDTYIICLCLISGLIFSGGILLLFFAFSKAEASRVAPVSGATIPLVTFILSWVFEMEKLHWLHILGMLLLIFGGLLISFDLPLKLGKKKFFSGFYYAFAAGFFLAVAYVIFKHISSSETFVTWYIWTRFGGFIGACLLFAIPLWRKNILKSFRSAKKDKKQTAITGSIFLGNKIAGGLSTLMINYAIGIGSVTLINALVSLQYVFLLMIVALFSTTHAKIFQEKILFWDWAQKIAAIFIIAAGAALIYV